MSALNATRNSYNSPQAAMCRQRLKPRPISYSSQDLSPVARWKAVVVGGGGAGHGRGNCILINVGRGVDNTRGNGFKKSLLKMYQEWGAKNLKLSPQKSISFAEKKMKKGILSWTRWGFAGLWRSLVGKEPSTVLRTPQIQKGKRQIIGNRNAELGGEKKGKRSPSVQHPDALYSIYRCYICGCWFYPWKVWWIAASPITNLVISVFFRSYCIGQASILDARFARWQVNRSASEQARTLVSSVQFVVFPEQAIFHRFYISGFYSTIIMMGKVASPEGSRCQRFGNCSGGIPFTENFPGTTNPWRKKDSC